jgi:uncharacterized membrane protein affecting hemolysin expression
VSFATGLSLLLLWSMGRSEDAHVDHFGSKLASALASQVLEPLIKEDLIHLGVLANRIIELPEVIGTTVYTVNDKMLAISGDVQRGRPFTRPVVQNDTIVGYVRLHIDEDQFGDRNPSLLIALSLLLMFAVPAATLLLLRVDTQRKELTPPVTVESEPTRPPDPCYLVTVNLFNQLSLSSQQCKAELASARALAEAVARLYQGEVLDLPGTGLLITFGATGNDDRAFHVVCAACALSQLLAANDSPGRYRLSAHLILLDDGQAIDLRADEIAETAVLSALAKDNSIAISGVFFDQVPYSQRIQSERMNNPLLEELESTSGVAYLVRGLAPPHGDLVTQQVQDLQLSDHSTASESTF